MEYEGVMADDKSMERTALLMMKGLLLEMPQEQRNKVLDLVETFKRTAKVNGMEGEIALTIANLEYSIRGES